MLRRRVNRVTGVSRGTTQAARSSNQLNSLRDRMNSEAGRNLYFVRANRTGIGRYREGGQGGHGSP